MKNPTKSATICGQQVSRSCGPSQEVDCVSCGLFGAEATFPLAHFPLCHIPQSTFRGHYLFLLSEIHLVMECSLAPARIAERRKGSVTKK